MSEPNSVSKTATTRDSTAFAPLLGVHLIDALSPPFRTDRRSGNNPKGISIRHALLPNALVCHIDVDKKTDEVTGVYFNCEKNMDRAKMTAGALERKLHHWRTDPKRGGISPYIMADFSAQPTLDELLAFVSRAFARHQRNPGVM